MVKKSTNLCWRTETDGQFSLWEGSPPVLVANARIRTIDGTLSWEFADTGAVLLRHAG
ncbi:MAG: hypothetical protein J6D34_04915 [Atopobiaceae bacterium]|nr:hypothetical protein [Atopobiaceae bacterium]